MAQGEITGLFQWLKYGTGATADTDTGLIDGGDLNINPDTRNRLGIGGTQIRRGGLIVPAGAASMYVTATNQALCRLWQRASYPRGALTELEFEGGADEWEIAYHDTVITDWTFDYAQGEGLKHTLSWGGKTKPDEGTTGGAQAEEPADDFEDYEFVITWQGNEYAIHAASIAGTNNVLFEGAADTKAAGSKRFPTHYKIGVENLTLGLSTFKPLPHAALGLYLDNLPTNLGVVLTGSNGTNVVTLTLANLAPADPLTFGFVDPNTAVDWTYGFLGDSWNGSLTFGWA